MTRIWSPENRYRIWFEIEAHACDAKAALGIIPENVARAVWERGAFEVDRIDEIERETRHDVIAFLTNLAEHVGPEGVAYVSGRRRNGGPLTREAFESDLRREGFEVIHGGQQGGSTEDLHAHDFDARIMVLGGEITVTRDDKPETFHAGDHCELPAGCLHTTQVGPEGVALLVGKAYRRASVD